MKPVTGEPEIIINFSSRESLLKTNAELIADLRKRISARRFRVAEGDSVKLGYARCLISAIRVYSQVLRDVEVTEIKKELEELRELVNSQACNQSSINGRSK